MMPESGYGEVVVEAHHAGDLHIHGFEKIGGHWASWERTDIVGDVAIFVSKANNEWHGFQKLSNFDSPIQNDRIKILKPLVGSGAKVFLSFDNQECFRETLEGLFTFLGSSGSGKIVPIITFSKAYDWDNSEDLPIFNSVNTLGSPLFSMKSEKGAPWLDSEDECTGVLDTITLNLPRIAYEAKNENDFFGQVDKLTNLAVDGLEMKRAYLEKALKYGEMPVTSSMIGSFEGFFSAVGVVGVNEALQNLTDRGIGSMQGKAIAYKTLELIRDILGKGEKFCLAAEPSEEVTYRLARLDREKHPDMKVCGVNAPFYTRSTSLPVDYTDDLWDALEHQRKLQTFYAGGSIFNIVLGNKVNDTEGCKLLVRRIFEKLGIPCFAFSPPVSVQGKGGFERLGYWYKPVAELSAGEKEEVGLRRPFAVASGW